MTIRKCLLCVAGLVLLFWSASRSVAAPYVWHVDQLEPDGYATAIDVGANNVVHVVGRANDVGMFHYSRPAETGPWQREILSGSSWDGYASDIIVDDAGNPHVSFQYYNGGIYYRRFNGTAWEPKEIVHSGSTNGTSIVLDPTDGAPCIATAKKIAYGHYDTIYSQRDTVSGTWASTVVDTLNSTHGFISDPSLTITPDGLPKMCYIKQEYSTGELLYASFDGTDWTSSILDTWGHGINSWPTSAMALDENDNPWIAYLVSNSPASRELRVVHCDGADWDYDVVIPLASNTFGWDLDAAFDATGRLHIAHSAHYGQIQHAFWDGIAWQNEVIPGAAGRYNSLAFDLQGLPWQAFGGSGNASVASAIPEPSTLILFALAITALVVYRWRRRRT